MRQVAAFGELAVIGCGFGFEEKHLILDSCFPRGIGDLLLHPGIVV